MRTYSTFRVQEDYAVPLLEVLADMPDHQARKRAVISEIEKRHAKLIPAEHREPVPTGRDIRWTNWVAWERFELIQLGLMEAPAFGIWAISEAGLQWLQQNPTATRIDITPQMRAALARSRKPKQRSPKASARRGPAHRDEENRSLEIYRHEVRSIRAFLGGRGTRPTDEHLCDWVQFCYTFELYAEGRHLFSLVDARAVNDWLYRRSARLAKLCGAKARG